MALIESVTLTESKNPESGHFHVRICLGIDKDFASVTMPRLMKWYEVSCISDPKAYEEELANSKLEFVPLNKSNMFEVKIVGKETQRFQNAWTSGLDALHLDDSGRHLVMSEYVQDTSVTRAIVQELHKLSLDRTDDANLDRLASYVEPLLVCLYMHWD